jgi:hypothetical protein
MQYNFRNIITGTISCVYRVAQMSLDARCWTRWILGHCVCVEFLHYLRKAAKMKNMLVHKLYVIWSVSYTYEWYCKENKEWLHTITLAARNMLYVGCVIVACVIFPSCRHTRTHMRRLLVIRPLSPRQPLHSLPNGEGVVVAGCPFWQHSCCRGQRTGVLPPFRLVYSGLPTIVPRPGARARIAR